MGKRERNWFPLLRAAGAFRGGENDSRFLLNVTTAPSGNPNEKEEGEPQSRGHTGQSPKKKKVEGRVYHPSSGRKRSLVKPGKKKNLRRGREKPPGTSHNVGASMRENSPKKLHDVKACKKREECRLEGGNRYRFGEKEKDNVSMEQLNQRQRTTPWIPSPQRSLELKRGDPTL